MKALILRCRQLRDIYRQDPQGEMLAHIRDNDADVLQSDACKLRKAADLPGTPKEDRSAYLALARTLSDRASSIRQATTLHDRCVHEARVSPRSQACGNPRAVYVDPTSEYARHSAGACRREASPDAHALRGDRGTYIAYLRREVGEEEIPTHKVRHARKRRRRGGKKHK